ncbi:hypothetical protein BH20CHL4_BH20CHL4_01530 [soil metagenome]
MSMSRRITLLVLFAVLALPALQLSSPASMVAQDNDDAELLAGYVDQVQNALPDAGPVSGTLSLDGGPDTSSSLGVELADQVIHLEFQAPQVDADEIWAVAVAFRSSGGQFHYFVYWSDGRWSFAPVRGGNVQSGEAVMPEPGAAVSIDIAAAGPDGYVGINGEYTTTLDLSSELGAGDVLISANLIGTFDSGDEPVSFSNFTVWPLPSDDPPAGVAATPQAEATPAKPAASPQAEPIPAEPAASPQAEPIPAEPTATPPVDPAPAGSAVAAQTNPEIQLDPSLDDESQFNALLLITATQPIIFGPVNDSLEHDPDSVAFYPANLSVTDFAARVECIGTVAVADGFWDCGIAFRNTETAAHYRVAYVSDGYWFLSVGAGEPLLTGTDAPVSDALGDKVTLNLIVIGASGYFGINGEFVARFDLSELPGPGSVDVASAFFNDTYIPGGALQFEDFVVWSLDSTTGDPAPTATQQVTVEQTPTEASILLTPTTETGQTPAVTPAIPPGSTSVVGTTYTSPTYGYSLSWNDAWTVDSVDTDETGDYLDLSNGVVVADLIGEPWDLADGSCFDRLVLFYSSDPAYSDIQSATDNVSAHPGIWDITGILTMTYTDEEDGAVTDYINYAACSELPGQNSIVSLEQFVPVAEFRTQVAAMDDLRGSFVPNVGAVVVEATTTPAVEASPTAIAAQTSNVVGTTYTSPSFGYSFSWDGAYEVEIDQSESGVDYLRIVNETVSVDLFAAASDNTPAECVDDLVLYYENEPLYTDVQFVTDAQNQPLRTPGDGYETALISFTQTGADGAEAEQFDYFTCIRLEEQGVVVVLELFMAPSDFVLQSEAITALQEGLVLPEGAGVGPPVVIVQTPAAEPTVDAPATTIAPPPAEEPLTATFLLAPIGDSGVQGTGTLEGQARQVTMTAIVLGVTPGALVTIHRGACDAIGPVSEPDYIVGELDESGLLREDVQVRLTVLVTNEPYSVVVYGGGDDFSAPVACGEIAGG